MIAFRSGCAAALVLLLNLSPVKALTLTPDTLLGIDAGAPAGSTTTLVEYTKSGTISETLSLSGTSFLGVASGAATLGNNVYVAGTSGAIGSVDLNTGAVTALFDSGLSGSESLGTIGGHLVLADTSVGNTRRFSTSGLLIASYALPENFPFTGVTSDGVRLFAGAYGNGSVYTYDLAGAQTGVFATGFGAGKISDVAYDASDNTLWVSFGFGDDVIRHYSLTGTLLGSFNSARPLVNGLSVVPEPSAFGVAGQCWVGGVAPSLILTMAKNDSDRSRSDRATRATRLIYRIAAIYGLIALVPMLFTPGYFGEKHPPAVNHLELYFGFVTVALAWQWAFWVIAKDPVRYRAFMPVTWLEKAGFCVATIVLFLMGRLDGELLAAGIIDGVLGVAFVVAWIKTPSPSI